MKTRHQLIAPVSGRIIALGQVPDPIFSEKLTGDGLAILANSTQVVAPCDGEITLFFDTKHAFAITTDDGVQILVHVGLDTILLEGVGIKA
ncbi:MAG: PTS glucose transporter subunit IIA, partial [Selenomonadaceae bacterium]|nr:PTS glucose transporter subunit IIA [Selenomonadaceae bacterium]